MKVKNISKKKMIDIIIPIYNTPESYIKSCLSSIASQINLDEIKVFIVDDNSCVDYSSIIDTYSKIIDIKYVKLPENMGVGNARQWGINLSTSPYICFIDADDQLYSPYSLYLLYFKIRQKKCDFVTGNFIREYLPEKVNDCPIPASMLKKVGKNQTWVFSRLFSREFLIENDISFVPLRYNEDVAFMQLCFAISKNNEFIDNTIYVQHCNMESLTRSSKNEFNQGIKGILNFVQALCLSQEKKRELKIEKNPKCFYQACDSLAVCYWYFIQCYEEKSLEETSDFLVAIQNLYNMFTDDYPNIEKTQELKQSYFMSFESMKEISKTIIPQITFWELLKDLKDNKNTSKYSKDCRYEFGEVVRKE